MLTRQKTYFDESSKLYLVPTPIGNMEDMTIRSINVLKMVDEIYCEDTRITGTLLKHFEIDTKLKSYNVMTENELTSGLIEKIKNGKNIAVVTDAGLPGISDPGYLAAREAIKEGISVVPLPGPSASLTALIASGLPTKNFYFIGFLSSKESLRKKELNRIKDYEDTLIIYEAPHRIKETLENMLEILGNRNICLAREITKKYEEFLRGTIQEILEVIDTIKGEMVIIIEGNKNDDLQNELNKLSIKEHYNYYIQNGEDYKNAMKKVAIDLGVSKSEVYNILKRK
jgi:16S rRNA (cytidine1402-2'-O)-methyltransferase